MASLLAHRPQITSCHRPLWSMLLGTSGKVSTFRHSVVAGIPQGRTVLTSLKGSSPRRAAALGPSAATYSGRYLHLSSYFQTSSTSSAWKVASQTPNPAGLASVMNTLECQVARRLDRASGARAAAMRNSEAALRQSFRRQS